MQLLYERAGPEHSKMHALSFNPVTKEEFYFFPTGHLFLKAA